MPITRETLEIQFSIVRNTPKSELIFEVSTRQGKTGEIPPRIIQYSGMSRLSALAMLTQLANEAKI